MKKTLILTLALLLTTFAQAQPGPPFSSHNLNNIQTPFSSGKQHYYIDSTTLESSYARLEEYPDLNELHLKLDHIPAGLVSHGRYIKEIHIHNPHHIMSTNDRWAQPAESLYDLELLNYFPSLEQISIMGYRIDHRADSVAQTLAKCSVALVSVIDQTEQQRAVFGMEHALMIYPPASSSGPAKALLRMHDVNIVHFPSSLCIRSVSLSKAIVTDPSGIQKNAYIQFVSLTGAPQSELPGWLPPSMEWLSVSNCDSLISIKNLEIYKNLKDVSITGCFHLKTFPKTIPVKKLHRLDIQLHPKNSPDLIAALSGIDTIQEMEFEFYEGIADMDFKHHSMHLNRLIIGGSSFRNQTLIKLANLQNLSVSAFLLSGKFTTIPDVSVMRKLEEFHFYPYAPITDKTSIHTLEKIKNLSKFSLHNYGLSSLPEVFFENNPHLTHISLVGTGIEELSFGKTVLIDLKYLYLRQNMKLEKIPPKTFYPNAWKPDAHNNKKEEYNY